MKILLVEDDRPTAAVLSELLTAQHYLVELAIDGETALELATAVCYDLVVLDIMIPKLDGMSVCRRLRSQGYQKPILLLTAQKASLDVVRGLDAGADDYVAKPYNLPELLARIRALLRRGDLPIASNLLTWGQLCVNLVSAEVFYGERAIALTPKEYGLLGLFLRHPQQVFSRSDLVDRLWSIDATPSEGTVTNLIKDLRHKLKAGGMTVDLLTTVYGLGYRLNPPPATAIAKASTAPDLDAPKPERSPNLTRVNQVIQRYQTTFGDRIAIFTQVAQALRADNLEPTLQHQAAEEVHKLVGAMGSFGYEVGSTVAYAIAQMLVRPLRPSDLPQFEQLLERLKQSISKPPTPLNQTLNWEQPNEFHCTQITPSISRTNPAHVIVLDDDLLMLDIMQNLLQPWGLAVTTLQEPARFWDMLAARPADLLLLDLQMPEISGINLCRTVRQDPQWGNLPILVVTAHTDLDSVQQVFAAGADDFIGKPIAGPELVTRVISRIERSRLQQELATLKLRIGQ